MKMILSVVALIAVSCLSAEAGRVRYYQVTNVKSDAVCQCGCGQPGCTCGMTASTVQTTQKVMLPSYTKTRTRVRTISR